MCGDASLFCSLAASTVNLVDADLLHEGAALVLRHEAQHARQLVWTHLLDHLLRGLHAHRKTTLGKILSILTWLLIERETLYPTKKR